MREKQIFNSLIRAFVDGDDKIYKKLSYSAQKLGSAFQKINFLS